MSIYTLIYIPTKNRTQTISAHASPTTCSMLSCKSHQKSDRDHLGPRTLRNMQSARDSLVLDMHSAKKCRNAWGEAPFPRAGPHPRRWKSPGRSASRAQWRRELEREGRALASAVQHARLSMWKIVPTGCPGGLGRQPGRRPIACAWPLGFNSCGWRWPAAIVTQARVGVQGRFLNASGSTWQPKYPPVGCSALRRLAARARCQTISAFWFCLVADFCIFLVLNPHTSETSTVETHTDGGAVIRKPGSAWPNQTALPQWTQDI